MKVPAKLGRLRAASSGLLVILALASCAVTLTIVATRGPTAPVGEAQQVQQIAAGLHCPVCKDLSVADSPAPLAQQMRQEIAQKLHAGESADQIRAGFVAAYGESVLMTPPKHGLAGAAYHLPLIVMAFGLLVSFMVLRRWLRKPQSDPLAGDSSPLSGSQRRALDVAIARLREEEPG
jgi:cytochrome c-type biogenesis protein CcmH